MMYSGLSLDLASNTLLVYVLANYLPFTQTNGHVFSLSLIVFLVYFLCSLPQSHSYLPLPNSLPGPSHPSLCSGVGCYCCMSHFGFCSPYSFSFTFPRPPAIFNSVIMAYSVGTWHSLSPTLHSCPWFSCGQRSFPEPLGRMEVPPLPGTRVQLSK